MHYILKFRGLLLIAIALLASTGLYKAIEIPFVYDLEQFFPADDPDVQYMSEFRSALERDDTFLLVAIDNEASIYDTSFLRSVFQFTKDCQQLPYVKSAQSIVTLREPIQTPFGYSFRKFIHPDKPERFSTDSTLIATDERVYRSLVSHDHRALVVSMKTEERLQQFEADSLQKELSTLIATAGFKKTHLAGVATTQSVFVSQIKQELVMYILLSILIVTIVLFFLFRSFWGIAIPLASVIVALALFLGYLRLTGQAFDIMSTMFPTLMLIFGMSDVIHLQSKYIDELDKGKDKQQALKISLREIGKALLLTSVTTAIGFLSLLTSSIPAIQRFGINAAAGVMIAYVFVVLFSSAALSFFNLQQLQGVKKQRLNWKRYSLFLYLLNRRNPRVILSVFGLVVILTIYGIGQISTNNYLLGDIPRSSQLRQDFVFFESKFSGVRPLEIAIIPGAGKKISDPDVLQEIDKLGQYLTTNYAIGSLNSPAVVFKSIYKSMSGGQLSGYALSEDAQKQRTARKLLESRKQLSDFKLMSEDERLGRLTARIKDTGSDSLSAQIDKIEAWISANSMASTVDFKFTGSVLLVDKNHEYLRKNLFWSLTFAFIMVGFIFALLFKDWRMVLVSIVPNFIPMLIAGAALGYSGIELKAVTSIIFTVSFGIAVDDTIHFLTRYKLERSNGRSVDKALRQTFLVSVKAITITTIVLIFGFLSLIFSDFTGTYYVGILVCVTLTSALIADVFLIPQLLYFINPGSRPKRWADNRND